MSDDLHEKTKRLLLELNYFLIHVTAYFVINIALVIIAFGDLEKRGWIFYILLIWAPGLIYHCIRVYGIDLLKSKNKKMNLIWSWLIKISIG